MSLLALSRRTIRADYPLPASGTPTVTPTYDGSNIIIHPSVVDMVAETGAPMSGYRWWRADTPFPAAIHENPCIWGSNDRINWTTPHGAPNPIDPWPGAIRNEATWFNSDTELIWDPDRERLVMYWREMRQGFWVKLHAASSRNGIDWDFHGQASIDLGNPVSPTIARVSAGEWRMMSFDSYGLIFTAPTSLGPWATIASLPTNLGYIWHAQTIIHDGQWWIIYSASRNATPVRVSTSLDGLAWADPVDLEIQSYRPTLRPSTEPGYMDVWGSRPSAYYRIPMSTWPAPPTP